MAKSRDDLLNTTSILLVDDKESNIAHLKGVLQVLRAIHSAVGVKYHVVNHNEALQRMPGRFAWQA